MAFSDPNEFRAIQFLSDGQISFRLPNPDGDFDDTDELALVAGVFPFTAFGATTPNRGALIMPTGGPVGRYLTLIV